jgi:hypothetical protein
MDGRSVPISQQPKIRQPGVDERDVSWCVVVGGDYIQRSTKIVSRSCRVDSETRCIEEQPHLISERAIRAVKVDIEVADEVDQLIGDGELLQRPRQCVNEDW